jgi:hypothetical protein
LLLEVKDVYLSNSTYDATNQKKVNNITELSIVLTIPFVIIFDLFLASNSIVPLRFVYDVSFALMAFTILYVSILLVKNKQMSQSNSFIVFPRITFILPIIINLLAVFSTISLDVPNIGSLNSNFLVQGANSLLPFFNYLLLTTTNGIILYFVMNRKREMCAYELPTFILGSVAIQVLLTEYGFQLGGITGIRLSLILFYVCMSAVFLWLCLKHKIGEIRMRFEPSDKLLLLLSAGILMMIFIPYGIYNLMGDNAVVTSSAISITRRGSLQPFYTSTDYYTPIGGFVAVIAAYSCNLSSILLASNLPFLASYLLLPFIVYHFLRKYFTDDQRIAIIGAVAAILMDGLAVLLLPAYKNNLTMDIINWSISPATKSLYFSTICWLWLTPFKTFSIASAIAACTVLNRRRIPSLLLAGALLALSFANPRQPFMAILLLLLLLGMKKTSPKDISIIGLSAVLSLGPVSLPTFYKITEALLQGLHSTGLIAYETAVKFSGFLLDFTTNPLLQAVFIAIILTMLILSLKTSYGSREKESEASIRSNLPRKETMIKFDLKRTKHNQILKKESMMFWSLSIVVLSYAALYAHNILPSLFSTFEQNIVLAALNYLVLRYHILIVLVVLGFFYFMTRAHTLKMMIALSTVAIATCLGVVLGLYAPVLLVVTALPALGSLVNSQKRIETCFILSIIILGMFSATFYSATVKNMELDQQPYFDDMPHVIHILIDQNADTNVFCPSSYDYFAGRMVCMAQLSLTSNQSSPLWIIDTRYTQSAEVRNLLGKNSTKVLYQGKAFILLEITP